MSEENPPAFKGRPYIGMTYRCCNVYSRIYLNRRGDAYIGHCPKCGGRVEIKAAPGGSREKFWTAE